MPDYNYNPMPMVTSGETFELVWTIVSIILALVGGIIVYFLFLKNEKDTKNEFLNWLRDFFNFKQILIEDILKLFYICLAIFITLYSFKFLSINFVAFIFVILFGNIALRIICEFILIIIKIWKNTEQINKKPKK